MTPRFIPYVLAPVLALTLALAGALTPVFAGQEDDELTAAIAQLSAEQKSALLVLVKGIVDAKATQLSPEDGAMKTVAAYVKAAESGDIDGLLGCFSETFDHYELGDKSGLRTFIEGVEAEGMLEGITGNIKDAEATVKGDTVIVYPVELEGIFGTVTYEFEMKSEGGDWKIVAFEMTGV